MKKIKIGLIGLGTVGAGVVKALRKSIPSIRSKSGISLELVRVAEKDLSRARGLGLKRGLVTKDARRIINDPAIDIVIELIGGIHPARELILKTLKNGKHVVTANKALLAECGPELFAAAKKYGKSIRFEASVGGGVPVIKALTDDFVANRIDTIYGIINGTCNFILTEMEEKACSFDSALKEAKRLGFAENNPTLDINGMDSAHKAVIMTLLGFGIYVPVNKLFVEGIQQIELSDIQYAKELGYAIKLLCIAKRDRTALDVRVHPTLLPARHPLSNVRGVYNAIYVKGDLIGEALLYGKGAGANPTSSAVIADVVDIARSISVTGECENMSLKFDSGIRSMMKFGHVTGKYYIRFTAIDKPGVLSSISGILSRYRISIANVTQKERRRGRSVPIVVVTHTVAEQDLRRALTLIGALSSIKSKPIAIRMESK